MTRTDAPRGISSRKDKDMDSLTAFRLLIFVVMVGGVIAGIVHWINSAQLFKTRRIKKHGVETTAEIVEVKETPFHGTKVAFMMNLKYDTPLGRVKRYYKRIIVKDRIIPYRDRFGRYFYQGQQLPIMYLPNKPDKFIVTHPVEEEEKKKMNQLFLAVVGLVVVLPFVVYWLRGLFG